MRAPVVAVTLAALALAYPAAAAPATSGVLGGFSLGGGLGQWAHGELELGWRFTPVVTVLPRAQLALIDDRNSSLELGLAVRLDGPGDVRAYVEPQLAYLSYGAAYDCIPGQPTNCYGGDATGLSAGLVLGIHLFATDHASGDLRFGGTLLHWRDVASGTRHDDVVVTAGLGFSFY
jgi:hypothetical protein